MPSRAEPVASDDLFRAAFDADPLGLAIVERAADGRHVVLDVNPAMRAIHDWGRDDASGLAVDALLAGPGSSDAYDDGWQERQAVDTAGQEVWTRWRVVEISSSDAGRPRLLVQVDLVTDRVKARLRAQRQARLLDLLPEPVIIRALDGTVLYWNTGAADTYGHPADYAVGRRTHDLLQTEFHGVTLPELEAQLATEGSWQGQLEHRHADGRVLRMVSKHVRDEHGDGEPVILEINIDATDRLAAQRALAASEAKFRSQFAHSTIAQFIRTVDGTIEEANPAMATLLGYRHEDLVGLPADRLFSPAVAQLRREVMASMMRGECDAVNGEAVMNRADGTQFEAELNVSVARGPDGAVERIIGFVQDITARKQAENALAHQAWHDSLTGLANRALLTQRITHACNATQGGSQTVGLLYLDLDGFKAVNDTFGHHIGDALLVEVGDRLRHCVRGGDTVARMGGDEFVVLCPDLDTPARLNDIARRVLAQLGEPYRLAGRYIDTVTASVGVSFPPPAADAAQALRDADHAMYQAKQSGKNRIGLHVADGSAAPGRMRRPA